MTEGSQETTTTATAVATGAEGKKRGFKAHLVRNIVLIVLAVCIVIAGACVWGVATGRIVPADAAAKYGTFDYISEADVTDYIMTYKEQMGYGSATDDEWAQFLAAYNLTPDRLRLSTVNELLTQVAIEKRASELGLSVSEEEINQTVEAFKTSYAFDDDTVLEETLETYGQTMEGFRETQRLALLKQKLLIADMTVDEPTDDEVLELIETYAASYESAEESEEEEAVQSTDTTDDGEGSSTPAGHTIKHSYLFAIQISGDEANLDDLEKVQQIKDDFAQTDMDVETFLALMDIYCDVEDLQETNGAMGWDIDSSDYSSAFATQLEKTDVGALSDVFNDDYMECFIWVDQGYFLPYAQDELEALDLDEIPESLYEYFRDVTLYQKRSDLSSEYFQSLVNQMDIVLYPMPSDVAYNVDMSAYEVTDTTDSTSTDDSEGSTESASSDAVAESDAKETGE